MSFKVGDQIVYIPRHAKDMFHPDAEFGFITGFNFDSAAFCRYWSNSDRTRLRTTANSEATPIDTLERYALKPQILITQTLTELGY